LYNGHRPHLALGDRTPMAIWRAGVTGVLGNMAVDIRLCLDSARAFPTRAQPPQQEQAFAA
jgi:hypothetical protein